MTVVVSAADTPPTATYKSAAELIATLEARPATLTSEVQNTDRHRINVVRPTGRGNGGLTTRVVRRSL